MEVARAGRRDDRRRGVNDAPAIKAADAGVAMGITGTDVTKARTAAFCTLAFAQLMFSFGCRSFRYTLPQLGAFSNPWLLGAIAASISLQLAAVTLPFLRPLFKVDTTGLSWE